MKSLTDWPAILVSGALAMVSPPDFAGQAGQSPAALSASFSTGSDPAAKSGAHEVVLKGNGAVANPFETIASAAMPLRPGPHLFLDESLLESSWNVTRRVNVPSRDPAIPNPLVTGKEDGCFQPYMTVLRNPQTGRFRLWYGVHTADFNSSRSHLGYLESPDGFRWMRPHRVLT
ncbi:MAG: hypothetical protein HY674_03890, partial [Chloroflexi bacterium]|nr:hypothetical protein [Chloroflexota bacterium]